LELSRRFNEDERLLLEGKERRSFEEAEPFREALSELAPGRGKAETGCVEARVGNRPLTVPRSPAGSKRGEAANGWPTTDESDGAIICPPRLAN
jgi:hypothetical protein